MAIAAAASPDDGVVLLAKLTEGKSLDSRDIENSVQAAQQKALLRAVRNGGPEHYSMSLDDFDLVQSKLFQLLAPHRDSAEAEFTGRLVTNPQLLYSIDI